MYKISTCMNEQYIKAIIHATRKIFRNLNHVLKSSKKRICFFVLGLTKEKIFNKIINISIKDHYS